MPAVAILGGVVVFAVFGFLTGRTLGWLRYSITEIPLASILALACSRLIRRSGSTPARTSAHGRIVGKAMGLAAVAMVALAVPVGAMTMLNRPTTLLRRRGLPAAPVLYPNEPIGAITPFAQYEIGSQAATYLDQMNLGGGRSWWTARWVPDHSGIRKSGQFITIRIEISSRLCWIRSLRSEVPVVPEDVGYQSLDAVNRAYPGIYDTGAGIGQLEAQFSSGQQLAALSGLS